MQLCSRTVLYVSCCSWSAATVPWFTLRRCHHAKYCVRSLAAHAAWLRLAASCQLLLTVSSNGTVAHALAIATAPTIACAPRAAHAVWLRFTATVCLPSSSARNVARARCFACQLVMPAATTPWITPQLSPSRQRSCVCSRAAHAVWLKLAALCHA